MRYEQLKNYAACKYKYSFAKTTTKMAHMIKYMGNKSIFSFAKKNHFRSPVKGCAPLAQPLRVPCLFTKYLSKNVVTDGHTVSNQCRCAANSIPILAFLKVFLIFIKRVLQ